MTHCIPYNPDCTVCNPPYEWPDNYKPIPPKAVIHFAAMTQENYAALTARLTVLADAAREANELLTWELSQHEWPSHALSNAQRIIAAALGAERA